MIKFDQKQITIIVLVGVIIIGTIGYYFYTTIQDNNVDIIEVSQENIIAEAVEINEKENQIIVHIAGEVKNPGIIKIEEGARIADIIEKAGGLNEQADIGNINLAYEVEDGQKITIPKIGNEIEEYITEESSTNTSTTQSTSNKKINLNKATSEELQTLQGIRTIYSTENYCLSKREWKL